MGITFPPPGETVSGPIGITVAADDLNGVARVEVWSGTAVLGSCTAIQQKSSRRGRPQCSMIQFRPWKSVAAWSTSCTSKASFDSGMMVGPLWTWMFLMPSLSHSSKHL